MKIAIIGAGSSGIVTAKNLMQVGLHDITIYEQSDKIGGNWVYTTDVKHSSVYETTHIITSKYYSQLEDFPMPEHYPDYPSHWLMAEYFNNYATTFGINDKIKFNTTVNKVLPTSDNKWIVETTSSSNIFDVVIVANGHHWNPRIPSYAGKFDGEFIHSHFFKNNKPFEGKRVLVIGAGNSGCDAAVEVARVAKFTSISMRRGYHFIPKFVFGQPADVIANKFQFIPDALLDTIYKFTLRLQNGSYASYGLQEPDHGVRQSHPVSNSELLYYIKHGRISPRVDIEKFDGKKVHFKDGKVEEYDTIIASTGFKITFPFFDTDFINFEDKDVDLYKRIFHTKHKNLMFVGLIQASGCFWKLADYQSKLLANHLVGNYPLPDNMQQEVQKEINNIRNNFTKSARHLIEVDYFKYSQEIKKLIPKNAPKWDKQAVAIS